MYGLGQIYMTTQDGKESYYSIDNNINNTWSIRLIKDDTSNERQQETK